MSEPIKNQKRVSSVDVIRKQLQPVSLHTRWSTLWRAVISKLFLALRHGCDCRRRRSARFHCGPRRQSSDSPNRTLESLVASQEMVVPKAAAVLGFCAHRRFLGSHGPRREPNELKNRDFASFFDFPRTVFRCSFSFGTRSSPLNTPAGTSISCAIDAER